MPQNFACFLIKSLNGANSYMNSDLLFSPSVFVKDQNLKYLASGNFISKLTARCWL